MHNSVTPTFAEIKNKPYNYASYKTNEQYKKLRIKNEIRYLYRKKNFMSLQLYNIEQQALKMFNIFWYTIKSSIIEKLSQFIKIKYNTLNMKLQQLAGNQNTTYKPEQTDFQFQEPIKNLTNIDFSNSELEHVYKGFKSNFQYNNKHQIKEMIIDAEYIIQNSSVQNKQELRYQINQKINNINKDNHQNLSTQEFSQKMFNTTLNKIKNHNLTVNKADKGNIITIESKDSQIQKVQII